MESSQLSTTLRPPQSVRVIRTLGHGRAARAELVEAAWNDGRKIRCVEKRFVPGRLTRAIYRLSFQAPFPYRHNRDAVRACYYRRRVAAAAFALDGNEASVAAPLYVRYDRDSHAWVLAAQWIDGRGLRPAPPDPRRLLRVIRGWWPTGRRTRPAPTDDTTEEIDQLVALMKRLEQTLKGCGLSGSGWQVSPRALVSTANLLRRGDRYHVIDLESGMPAVLVPRYCLSALALGTAPPFDDLDPRRLRSWLSEHRESFADRFGTDALVDLERDVSRLIACTQRWKRSEAAWFRRPWTLASPSRWRAWRRETVRRWRQQGLLDRPSARRASVSFVWFSWLALFACLPGVCGRRAVQWWGRRAARDRMNRWLTDASYRRSSWDAYRQRCCERWAASGRLGEGVTLTPVSWAIHRTLQSIVPPGAQRWLTDRRRRREKAEQLRRLLLSPEAQFEYGKWRIEKAIAKWEANGRLLPAEAARLRQTLCGREVGIYLRGFGMHLATKALGPLWMPAKLGGAAAFLAGGSGWCLLPWLLMPFLRMLVSVLSYWTTRHNPVPHAEAIVWSLLPTVGNLAFPVQMFARRPELASFLVRDAASTVGRRLPVYGGGDSRTELELIRLTDHLLAVMRWATALTAPLRRRKSLGEPLRRTEGQVGPDCLRLLPHGYVAIPEPIAPDSATS